MKDNTAVYSDKQCFFQWMAHFLMPQYCQKSVLDSAQANSYQLNDQNYRIQIYSSIDDVPQNWDTLMAGKNIFQERKYLKVVETERPQGMQFAYVLYYKNNRPIGVNVCQIVRFNAAENINGEDQKGLFSKTKNQVKSALTKRLEFKLLVSGNMLLTGEHGYYFDSQEVSTEQAYNLVTEGMEKVMEYQKTMGEPVHGTMIKDVFGDHKNWTKGWTKEKKYKEVVFQPNMILKFREDWTCFEDYMGAMSSKYRVRVRRARKKGETLECREFSLEDLKHHQDQINFLYKRIADKAGFNMVELNERYLYSLKENLGEAFRIFGYFDKDQFVGFYTTIRNGHELEAHFLGFEEQTNQQYQLYLNMLYDIIDIGFNTEGIKEVVFARTAMEIKSSVGAVAHDMFCYFKHPNSIFNGFIPRLISYFEPKVSWKPRHPFKEKKTES